MVGSLEIGIADYPLADKYDLCADLGEDVPEVEPLRIRAWFSAVHHGSALLRSRFHQYEYQTLFIPR